MLAHNGRMLRETAWHIQGPGAGLMEFLRRGRDGPLWPEKGYKSRAQRRAEEESRAAAEEEAKRQHAEREVLRERLNLHQLGRPVPEAPVEG